MTSPRGTLLVVSGEASGDRIAASVVRALGSARDELSVYGMGGPALQAAGARLFVDLRRTTAMGASEVASRLPAVLAARAKIELSIARRPPRAALLVDYTEFNLSLGRRLRRLGTRVLFAVAPQLWAWRPGRLPSVRRAVDRLAVILPFEEPLFRAGGIDACYVGHPALETEPLPRDMARRSLGLADEPAIAILPGSRPHEVRATLPTMLEGFRLLTSAHPAVRARLLLAASLDANTRAWALARSREAEVETHDVDAEQGAGPLLEAFDAAVVTSGTATLECALAGAPPLTVYRAPLLTALIARRLIRTKDIALPNIVLGDLDFSSRQDAKSAKERQGILGGERRYPELLQERFTAEGVARELAGLLEKRERYRELRDELRLRLGAKLSGSFGERVARLLRPWIEGNS